MRTNINFKSEAQIELVQSTPLSVSNEFIQRDDKIKATMIMPDRK